MHGQLLVLNIIAATFSLLSFISCIVNIILIIYLRQWNFFLAILFYTAICEALYSGTFYFNQCVDWGFDANAAIALIQIFSGIAVTLWTNVLSCVILYILKYRQAAHIIEYFPFLSCVVYLPALADSFAQFISWYEEDWYAARESASVYYWLRVLSILFNFVVFAYIYRKTARMRGNVNKPTAGEKSLFVVANRMMYYPIIQFLSRVFNAIYEKSYSFGQFTDVVPTEQFILRCLVCCTQPTAGLGFLIIFLFFQPRAVETLSSLLFCRYVAPTDQENATLASSGSRVASVARVQTTSGNSRLSASTLRGLAGFANDDNQSDRSSLNTIRMSDASEVRPVDSGMSTTRETDIIDDIKFSLMDDNVLFQYIASRSLDEDSLEQL